MPGILNYECPNNHRFQKISNKDRVRCPTCRKMSEILWVTERSSYQQMQTPIVMWRYADGRLGVAGGKDSKTPKNAERIEIRSRAEYTRYAKEINQQFRDKDEVREERFLEAKDKLDRRNRSNLAWAMGQESDPFAKDIYRTALERGASPVPSPSYREYFSVVMENDRSNYE